MPKLTLFSESFRKAHPIFTDIFKGASNNLVSDLFHAGGVLLAMRWFTTLGTLYAAAGALIATIMLLNVITVSALVPIKFRVPRIARDNPQEAGAHLHANLALATLLAIPAALISAFAKKIFIALGQPKDAAQLTQKFANWFIGIAFVSAWFSSIEQFLFAAKHYHTNLAGHVTFGLSLAISSFLLINSVSLSQAALALGAAFLLANAVGLITAGMSILVSNAKKYQLLSFSGFKNIKALMQEQIKNGLFIALTNGSDVLFQIYSTLLIGRLGKTALAAVTPSIEWANILFVPISSIGWSLTHLTSDKRIPEKREYLKIALAMTAVFNSLLILAFSIFRKPLAEFFISSDESTDDEDQDDKPMDYAPTLLAINIVRIATTSLLTTLRGPIEGMYKTKFTATTAVASTWVIGAPLAFALSQFTPLWLYGPAVAGIAANIVAITAVARGFRLIETHDVTDSECFDAKNYWGGRIGQWFGLFDSPANDEKAGEDDAAKPTGTPTAKGPVSSA